MYIVSFILCLPVFFIWNWFFKKIIKVKKNQKVVACLATFITLPIIYFTIMVITLSFIGNYSKHNFDKKKWFENKEERYRFSENIINSNMLIGKNKQEIFEILGYEGNLEQSDNWFYYLGTKPGFTNIEPYILEIIFKNGKVISVKEREA